jgi:hypothetical protein
MYIIISEFLLGFRNIFYSNTAQPSAHLKAKDQISDESLRTVHIVCTYTEVQFIKTFLKGRSHEILKCFLLC